MTEARLVLELEYIRQTLWGMLTLVKQNKQLETAREKPSGSNKMCVFCQNEEAAEVEVEIPEEWTFSKPTVYNQ